MNFISTDLAWLTLLKYSICRAFSSAIYLIVCRVGSMYLKYPIRKLINSALVISSFTIIRSENYILSFIQHYSLHKKISTCYIAYARFDISALTWYMLFFTKRNRPLITGKSPIWNHPLDTRLRSLNCRIACLCSQSKRTLVIGLSGLSLFFSRSEWSQVRFAVD